ncbi:brain and acute leukemia cytoplasmic protein isoform X2 [Lagopus muta]|uniref:brain and acute leukemia cytoplasmic protein isoform X2 n=1 Tax=Lagopus muta TaxID=64668 RepID=UPI0020A159AA|nr:brain and acute leukemia cytoplasmic protein isoform X2 [Lagopus muta]
MDDTQFQHNHCPYFRTNTKYFPRLKKHTAINAFIFSLYTKALPKCYHFLFHTVVKIQFIIPIPGILEDGKSTQTGGTTTPATTGILSTEKRTISGAQCVNTAGAGPPRQSSFRAAESKRDTQKMSTKEVTINVSKNNRPSDRRMTKNCVN